MVLTVPSTTDTAEALAAADRAQRAAQGALVQIEARRDAALRRRTRADRDIAALTAVATTDAARASVAGELSRAEAERDAADADLTAATVALFPARRANCDRIAELTTLEQAARRSIPAGAVSDPPRSDAA